LALVAAVVVRAADNSVEALRAVNRVTTALSDGDAAGAIAPFDKSCPDYEKLSEYFGALTNAFAITNEADLSDEQDSDDSASLTFEWTLTLASNASAETIRRQQQVKVEVARRGDQWRIINLSPVSFFSPS
jgi:hypothetical protein